MRKPDRRERPRAAAPGWFACLATILAPGPCAACGGTLPAHAACGTCPVCWASLPVRHGPGCLTCDLPADRTLAADGCPDCRGATEPRVIAALEYRGAAVSFHRRLKFLGESALAAPLGARMASAWRARLNAPVDLCVVVPPSRLRWPPCRSRAAPALARAVARRLGLPLNRSTMERRRFLAPQTGMSRPARRARLTGAFRASREHVENAQVLLIDDVATTGATLREAARALRDAGAMDVFGLVLARTPSRR